MLRELVVDRNGRPERPNANEAPQLSDEVWSIIKLCWVPAPTDRPTADEVCNKLRNILSMYPSEMPSDRLLERSPPIQRIPSAQSLPLEDIEPTPFPGSPPVPNMSAQSLPLEDNIESIAYPTSPVPNRSIQRPCMHSGLTFYRSLRHATNTAQEHYKSINLENSGIVTSVVQSSDGKILLAGLSEGSCAMWYLNVMSNIPQGVERSSDPVTAIAFELSGSTYVAGFKSGHVIYHHKSLSDSPFTTTLTGNDKPILCLHVLNIVVMALPLNSQSQDPVILKWCSSLQGSPGDIVDRLPLLGIAPSLCLCSAFSSDGKEIYIGTSSGSLFIFSTKNGQLVYRPFHLSIPPEGDTPSRRGSYRNFAVAECRSLAISPNGKKILVSYSSGEIRLWDIKARSYSILRAASTIRHSNIKSPAFSSSPVAFSPDGSYVAYASATDPRTVDIQDVSKKVLSSIDLDDAPIEGIQSLDISPNNRRLIVTFHNSSRIIVCVWDRFSFKSH